MYIVNCTLYIETGGRDGVILIGEIEIHESSSIAFYRSNVKQAKPNPYTSKKEDKAEMSVKSSLFC